MHIASAHAHVDAGYAPTPAPLVPATPSSPASRGTLTWPPSPWSMPRSGAPLMTSPTPIPVPTVTYAHDERSYPSARAAMNSASAGALTSVSNASGKLSGRFSPRRSGPKMSVSRHPGLGVVVMYPYRGDVWRCRSIGPKLATPSVSNSRAASHATTCASTASGRSPVANDARSTTRVGSPAAIATTHVVPPASTPAYRTSRTMGNFASAGILLERMHHKRAHRVHVTYVV